MSDLSPNKPHNPDELAAQFDWQAINRRTDLSAEQRQQLLFDFISENGLMMSFVGFAEERLASQSRSDATPADSSSPPNKTSRPKFR